jgi:S-adenosylmethionine hydrolase
VGKALRPIITLTTDFGLRDFYVAAMKAVLVQHCPDARLIDVTHQVPRHDVLCGSITLERAIDGFPAGTVHLAVVDPGVGTDRRILILITWAWKLHRAVQAYELTWRPAESSHTFHGRDILAPVAGRLACGHDIETLARPIDDPVLLDVQPADDTSGRIIHVDVFGNATTNISYDALRDRPGINVRVKRKRLGKLKRTYWDVAPGKPLALIGSSGLLEIAVRDGDAARQLKLKVGDQVQVSFQAP